MYINWFNVHALIFLFCFSSNMKFSYWFSCNFYLEIILYSLYEILNFHNFKMNI